MLDLQARVEAQSYRLTCEDAPSIDYMARQIAKTQQSYTQRGGVRPFGVSSMIAGFNTDKSPQLYLADPAGTYSAWKVSSFPSTAFCTRLTSRLVAGRLQAHAIGGRNEKAVQEFLEKNWTANLAEADAIRLTIKALLEVVDSGSKNMEVAVQRYKEPVRMLTEAELEVIIADIEREQEEAKKEKEASTSTAMET